MQNKLIDKRIWQIINLLGLSIFIYQYTQWEQGLWIVISIVAIIGPFYQGLTYNKANQRILGTLAGLLISVVIMSVLRYTPQLLPLLGVVLAWCAAFAMAQQYKYFIMMITIVICINYAYLDIPFWSYDITHYLATRGMGVFTGVLIYFCFEWLIDLNYRSQKVVIFQIHYYQQQLHKILNGLDESIAMHYSQESYREHLNRLYMLLLQYEKYQTTIPHKVSKDKRVMRHVKQLQRLLKASLYYAQVTERYTDSIKAQVIYQRLNKLVAISVKVSR